MTSVSRVAPEGGDPREGANPIKHTGPSVENQMMHAAHDSSVTFEEYVYYAKITRAEEKVANERYVEAAGPRTFKSLIKNRFSTGQSSQSADVVRGYGSSNEKEGSDRLGVASSDHSGISDAEWKNASRATRTAGWSGIFYLITTDILGPYSVP